MTSCLATACAAAVTGASAATAASPSAEAKEADDLIRRGKSVFDRLAPADLKKKLDLPDMKRWEAFATKVQKALQADSLADLAALAPEGRLALSALRLMPGSRKILDWLEQRMDLIEGARESLSPTKPTPPKPPPKSGVPPPPTVEPVPNYDLWMARVRNRPPPANATVLMPKLRAAFEAEGLPPELAWLAEAESSLNPAARSPVGAVGLFQFMPATAESMGLSTAPPDERTDPDRSAHAAARYLRSLHRRFGNWALAMAAYNAGEGRVGRMLAKQGAKSFTEIAEGLPAETRMYVPKVCALIATRAGVPPHQIAPPRR